SMTGRALASDDVGVAKATNCALVATRTDLRGRIDAVELPCIRCGDCATVCPPRLLPQQIHRAVLAGADDAAVQLGVWDCIDCGCCDYVCPSQIPLAQRFREARARLRERDAASARAAAARQRFAQHERRLHEAALAEQQAFDAARERARGAGDTGPAP
ncbi:MAG TPA: 4Fe-4S dicluster domain-containing protein, partial [Steroidobacteraceae bacterium]|nr:4Fe-4S dicluster domain-containing protein [Steroidobacteraceae bacterium]